MKKVLLFLLALPVFAIAQNNTHGNGIVLSYDGRISFGYHQQISDNSGLRYSTDFSFWNRDETVEDSRFNVYGTDQSIDNDNSDHDENMFEIGASILYMQSIFELTNGNLYLGIGPSYLYYRYTSESTYKFQDNSDSHNTGKSNAHILRGNLVIGYEHNVSENFRIFGETTFYIDKEWRNSERISSQPSMDIILRTNENEESNSTNFGISIGRIGFILAL
ncbi:MAG: hypothetical protein V1720_14940 [bacterium]